MYFQHIESDVATSRMYNNAQKAAAARRLGTPTHPTAKQASMSWNKEKHWANGATIGARRDYQARNLEQRLASWSSGNGKSRADHVHHRPGAYK